MSEKTKARIWTAVKVVAVLILIYAGLQVLNGAAQRASDRRYDERQKAYDEAFAEGYDAGFDDGYYEGYQDGHYTGTRGME